MAEQAVGAAERLEHLEMIVALADEELHRFACRLDGGREVARLALELGRLLGAVRHHDRAREPVDVALAGERLHHLVGELHVLRALRQAHRMKVVHAAAQEPALHDVLG